MRCHLCLSRLLERYGCPREDCASNHSQFFLNTTVHQQVGNTTNLSYLVDSKRAELREHGNRIYRVVPLDLDVELTDNCAGRYFPKDRGSIKCVVVEVIA